MKKSVALILILLLFLCGLFLHVFPKDQIIGRWETSNGLVLEVTEHCMVLQGISFPYSVQKGHTLLLDGGKLGPILGTYRFEGHRLHLTINGAEEIFFRS